MYLYHHLLECMMAMACAHWICSQTSLLWSKHGSKWTGQRSYTCYSAFALTAQQLVVCMRPYHAVVSRGQMPFTVQYALAHGTIHCIRPRQKHKSYVSRLLQPNIQLTSFSGSSIASWISTLSAVVLHYKCWFICTWPLTSPLSALFAHRSEVWLQIQETYVIRHSNKW